MCLAGGVQFGTQLVALFHGRAQRLVAESHIGSQVRADVGNVGGHGRGFTRFAVFEI